jgi:hypothetical protein
MGIVKEAFVEGRETTVDWDASKAKKDQTRLDVFSHNVDNFNGRKYGEKIALERIDPQTGKAVDYFSSRLEAAKWVVTNVLKMTSDPDNKKALMITGNMHMCMISGFKAYGSYWKYVNKKAFLDNVVKKSAKLKSKLVWVLDESKSNTSGVAENVHASIAEASKAIGVPSSTIRDSLKSPRKYGKYIVMEYNPTVKVMTFKSAAEAARTFGMIQRKMDRIIDTGKLINNIKIKTLLAKTKTVYQVLGDRGKIIGEFDTKSAVAAAYKVSKYKIDRALAGEVKIYGVHRVISKQKRV